MRAIPRLRAVVLIAGLIAVADCGGDGNPKASWFATAANASVLVPSVTTVTVKSTGGGFPFRPPTGAACNQQLWTYTLDVDTGRLSWIRCDVTGTGSNASDYTPAMGARILAAAELDSARIAVGAVHVSTRMICGDDKPHWTLEVESATTSLVYGDDFYACQRLFDHYVESDGLSRLVGELVRLAV